LLHSAFFVLFFFGPWRFPFGWCLSLVLTVLLLYGVEAYGIEKPPAAIFSTRRLLFGLDCRGLGLFGFVVFHFYLFLLVGCFSPAFLVSLKYTPHAFFLFPVFALISKLRKWDVTYA